MNFFKKKIILNPLHKKDDENTRRSFIRKSIAAVFGATVLASAEEIYSMESKTGYVYVKENGEVINNYKPAGEATPFLGQIMVFGFNFAPTGWFKCEGQLISTTTYSALFSLLGTSFGGTGVTQFGLPDFRGRVAIHAGQGAGLSQYVVGQSSGSEGITLLNSEIPSHTHSLNVSSGIGTTPNPANSYIAQNAEGIGAYTGTSNLLMNSSSVASAGSGLAHNNIQPVLSLNFCIARQGIFPARP